MMRVVRGASSGSNPDSSRDTAAAFSLRAVFIWVIRSRWRISCSLSAISSCAAVLALGKLLPLPPPPLPGIGILLLRDRLLDIDANKSTVPPRRSIGAGRPLSSPPPEVSAAGPPAFKFASSCRRFSRSFRSLSIFAATAPDRAGLRASTALARAGLRATTFIGREEEDEGG